MAAIAPKKLMAIFQKQGQLVRFLLIAMRSWSRRKWPTKLSELSYTLYALTSLGVDDGRASLD